MIKWKYTGDTKIYTGVKKIPPKRTVKKNLYFLLIFLENCGIVKKENT